MKVVEKFWDARDRVWKARNFPTNTCPASRITEALGFALLDGQPYPLLDEEPQEVGGYLVSTAASLYEARTEIERLKAELEKRPFSE
jgi:hypothetical protein